MITEQTTLVFGAGVSLLYGYPSGSDLVNNIFSKIQESYWTVLLNSCGIQDKDISEFRSELFLSGCASIDTFLEHRPEYIRIGKLAIALSLLSLENESNLISFDVRTKGIYHYLYSKLISTWEDLKLNQLRIITFNYDRSLEHFLFLSLKHTFNRPDEQIADVLSNFQIVHVHGWLGSLPWHTKNDARPYQGLFQGVSLQGLQTNNSLRLRLAKIIEEASEKIIIVSEADQDTKEFALASQHILSSSKCYFLGFGYNSANLKRLKLKESPLINRVDGNLAAMNAGLYTDLRPFRGSAYKLGDAERSAIQNDWKIWLPDSESDSLAFLKKYAELK